MKRIVALLLALCMILSLAACGKKASLSETIKDPGKDSPADSAGQELPYVEEVPSANVLDARCPIPADTGTLELTPVTFEDANLILNLPEGVTAREAEGTDNIPMDIHSLLTGEKTTHFEHFSDQQKSWQSLEAVFEGLSAFSSFFYKCDPIVTGNRNVMRILPEDLYGDTVGKRLAAHSAQFVLATVADDLSHPGFFIVIRFVTVHSILQVVIRH